MSGNLIKCSTCGNTIRSDNKYCDHCGTVVPAKRVSKWLSWVFFTLIVLSTVIILVSVTMKSSSQYSSPPITQSSNPPLPIGNKGKIAFISNRDQKRPREFQIYLMNADGTNQIRLANSPTLSDHAGLNHNPNKFSWSPYGNKIAYDSGPNDDVYDKGPDHNRQIWVMNADCSNQTRLTDNIVWYKWSSCPSWSPDGNKIAFQSNRDGTYSEIYVMDADGSNQTRLTNNHNRDDYIHPSWSPDGNKIAFLSGIRIYVMNADGSSQTKISLPTVGTWAASFAPSWSPDGSKIAFYSNTGPHSSNIYVVNADGSDQTRLTNGDWEDVDPSWSPDGGKIVFSSLRLEYINDIGRGNWGIYMMNADGSDQTRLTKSTADDQRPSWSR